MRHVLKSYSLQKVGIDNSYIISSTVLGYIQIFKVSYHVICILCQTFSNTQPHWLALSRTQLI